MTDLRVLLQQLGDRIFTPLIHPEMYEFHLKSVESPTTLKRRTSFNNPEIKKPKVMQISKEESKKVKLESYEQNVELNDICSGKSVDDSKSMLRGETRLRIHFESYGKPGEIPQTCRRDGSVVIPDGLVIRTNAYSQSWQLEIHHSKPTRDNEIRLTWVVTNLDSGCVTSVTETTKQMKKRQSLGWTIANQVIKLALDRRAAEFEKMLEEEKEANKIAHIKSMIKLLRPKVFCDGPLLFGLQHETLQQKMVSALHAA